MSCWLLAAGWPEFLATCTSPLGQLASAEQASGLAVGERNRERSEEKGKTEVMPLGHNLRSDLPSLCHILFFRSKSLGPAPYSRGGDE